MRYLIYIAVIVSLFGLNLGIFHNLQINNQIPNLLFLLSICFTLDNEGFDFFFIAFTSGIILDFYSTGFFGGYTLGLLIISVLMYLFINNILVIEVKFRSLAVSLLLALILLNVIVWLYGFTAYKLNITPSFISFKTYIDSFPINFFYNLFFIYPVYLFSSNLRLFVEKLNMRSKGVVR